MRCFLLNVEVLGLDEGEHSSPGHEGEVRTKCHISLDTDAPGKLDLLCALATDQIPITVLFQDRVQHHRHTLGFVLITLDGARDLLGMEHGEPSCLAEVWALSRHLVHEVLLDVVFLWGGREADGVVLVVLLDKVLQGDEREYG